MPGDLVLVVDKSSSEGNADGFATEDNPRFAISALSLPLNLCLSLYTSRNGGRRWRWVVSSDDSGGGLRLFGCGIANICLGYLGFV